MNPLYMIWMGLQWLGSILTSPIHLGKRPEELTANPLVDELKTQRDRLQVERDGLVVQLTNHLSHCEEALTQQTISMQKISDNQAIMVKTQGEQLEALRSLHGHIQGAQNEQREEHKEMAKSLSKIEGAWGV
jgi:hypothetical protein